MKQFGSSPGGLTHAIKRPNRVRPIFHMFLLETTGALLLLRLLGKTLADKAAEASTGTQGGSLEVNGEKGHGERGVSWSAVQRGFHASASTSVAVSRAGSPRAQIARCRVRDAARLPTTDRSVYPALCHALVPANLRQLRDSSLHHDHLLLLLQNLLQLSVPAAALQQIMKCIGWREGVRRAGGLLLHRMRLSQSTDHSRCSFHPRASLTEFCGSDEVETK